MNSLEQKLATLFEDKAPVMSMGAKATTAKFLPWVIIGFGVLGFMSWISSIKFFFGVAGVMGHMYDYAYSNTFMIAHYVIAPIIQAMAIYGGYLMVSKQLKGWRIVLYALLIGVVSHIFDFSVFGIVIDVIFAYLLFQIREQYVQKADSNEV